MTFCDRKRKNGSLNVYMIFFKMEITFTSEIINRIDAIIGGVREREWAGASPASLPAPSLAPRPWHSEGRR